MGFWDDVRWLCGMVEEVYKDTTKTEFRAGDVKIMHGHLHNVEKHVEMLTKRVREADEEVRRAEWKYFITTLPEIDMEQAADDNASRTVVLDGAAWEWDMASSILGIPFDVYFHDDDFLYLFQDGLKHRYYLESEFDAPDLLTRKQMGYGDNTKYRRQEDGTVEITGSGTVNMYQMFKDHGKLVDPAPYYNPIIDTEHRGKKLGDGTDSEKR